MTRYSDKRPAPGCRIPGCLLPGLTLTHNSGVLGWYCEDHDGRHKELKGGP